MSIPLQADLDTRVTVGASRPEVVTSTVSALMHFAWQLQFRQRILARLPCQHVVEARRYSFRGSGDADYGDVG